MSKPQGRCIYCGGTGLSKEHIFADWLREYIPRSRTEHNMSTTVQWPDREDRQITSRTGDTHARRLRRVCLKCNRGWMSDLQQSAKPFLVPMLEGRSTVLNRKAQKIVAAWITMTAMTAEFLDDEMVAVSQEDRDCLRVTGKTPRFWRIWISRYDGKKVSCRFHHHVFALTDQEVEGIDPYAYAPPNSQTTTIGFGDHFMVHLMSSEVGWSVVRRFNFHPGIKPNLIQIWPAAGSNVSWPPNKAFNRKGVEMVADEFYARVMRQMRKQAGL